MQLFKQYKRPFTLSLLCIVLALIIVSIMVLMSTPGIKKSGFKRNFASDKSIIIYHSDKITGLRAICGINDNHIYFETDTAGSIIETDSMLSNKKPIRFEIPFRPTVESLFNTFVDSSSFYITAGNARSVIRFDLIDHSSEIYHFPGNLFSEAVAAENGNFILRVYQKSTGKWDQIFTRWDPVKGVIITNENITAKEKDAGISTDGMLLFDKVTSRIIYVPYYSNQFFCIDTSLNVLYKKPMIYGLTTPSIKVHQENTRFTKIITNNSPLYQINHKSKAIGNRLYINSGIRSDNETNSQFSDNAVLDVYEITDGQYLGSFYIPKYKKERLKDFQVTANKIVVLYKNYIVTYSLPSIFKSSSRS